MKMSARKVQSRITELWKGLLGCHLTCFELGNVVRNIPLLREAAAKEILSRQDVVNEDLLCVMRYCEEVRIVAWDKFVLQNPSDVDLRYVIENVTPLGEIAGRMLLDRIPTKNFLFCVMERVSSLQNEAWEQYRDQIPTDDELCWVIRYIPALRVDAGKMLLRRNPRNVDLRCITVRIKDLAVEAGKMLLRRNPSKDDVQRVFDYVPELKDEASRILMRQASDIELRNFIKTHSGNIGESAEKELCRRTTKLSVADKEYLCSHAPSLEVEVERRRNEQSKARLLDELFTLGYGIS